MSKKKNNDSINKSTVVILILGIIILFGFIFSLPSLQDYYRKNFVSNDVVKKPKEEKIDKTLSATEQYVINQVTNFTFNDLTIEDITYETNGGYLTSISFNISSSKEIDLEELNYYLEFYNTNSEFITRRSLKGKVSNKKSLITIDLTPSNITDTDKMLISHISDDGIPNVKVDNTTIDNTLISCVKNGDTYNFYFNFSKSKKGILKKQTVRRNVYSSSEEEYTNNRLDLQKRINKYNNISGLTADMVEEGDHLVFLLEVDHSEGIDLKKVDESYVFGSGTTANIIAFKMEAEGFACNG